MSANAAGRRDVVFNTSFISLVYAFAGWILLEIWLVSINAGIATHSILSVPALVLAFFSVKHLPLYISPVRGNANPDSHRPPCFKGRDVLPLLLLLGMGVVLGMLIIVNSTLALFAIAAPLSFAPWSRISFCRLHCMLACAAIWSGLGATLAMTHSAVSDIFLPLACWVFWACACLAAFRRLEKLWQEERQAKSSGAPENAAPIAD
jgi:hypothetical protein